MHVQLQQSYCTTQHDLTTNAPVGAHTARSFDLPAYTAAILRQREERFSTVYAVCFITEAEAAVAAAVAGLPAPGDLLVTANSLGSIRSALDAWHMLKAC